MQAAGIIAEYNPLHNGHVHHLKKTREVTGCDYVM
ncbi:MAG TPA: nucleotidyltransferase family protein, partial [Clostridia bacterium]|nr:nucleotidyltransferase family protein [Clostridia bacterium]